MEKWRAEELGLRSTRQSPSLSAGRQNTSQGRRLGRTYIHLNTRPLWYTRCHGRPYIHLYTRPLWYPRYHARPCIHLYTKPPWYTRCHGQPYICLYTKPLASTHWQKEKGKKGKPNKGTGTLGLTLRHLYTEFAAVWLRLRRATLVDSARGSG
jgi:hypothetical protein